MLERHTQLAELRAAERDAGVGHGSIALVTGEAGAGKTSLVQRFTADSKARILWGLCDDLLTPRPLGPFRDMLGRADAGLFSAFLDAIVAELDRRPHPAVAVVEDAHWADEATLDAIRFVGRRIGRMPALLVVTYRDDEVPADHPLRLALGAVPAADLRRVRLGPLSRDAVARLAGRPDVDRLFRLTGGNPFFVREVLASPDDTVPLTVQDAVMARINRLSETGLRCVEVASVVPGPAERWLLDGCGVASGVDEAVRLGVLHADGDGETVSFSHELVRRAVEHGLADSRRRTLNDHVLGVLVPRDADPARLTHHAVRAGDGAAVARFAPEAARQAVELECHREAFEHYGQALNHADRFGSGELADLLDAFAREGDLTGSPDRVREATVRAIELGDALGDQERKGRSLRRLSLVEWSLGHWKGADEAAAAAVEVLSRLEPGPALVEAYEQRSRLAMVDFRPDEAISWGEKAIALSKRLPNVPVPANAIVTVATSRRLRDPGDLRPLVAALEMSVASGAAYAASRAYVNLTEGLLQVMRYEQAGAYLEEGIAYCRAHDLMAGHTFLFALRARLHLERGNWQAARDDALRALSGEAAGQLHALWVLATVQLRTGDPAAGPTFAEASRITGDGEAQYAVPLGLARAEAAWLAGDHDGASAAVRPVVELLRSRGVRGWVNMAALWQWRAGHLDAVPEDVDGPVALQIAGRWREAAARWGALGRPYEQADALAAAPEPRPLLDALQILDRLGAAPRASMVRRRLAEMGVLSVPRGPRDSTRNSPAGLTQRQTEVLELLAEDLTYRQIADRLHVSVKTVDHHVSAVREKLDVNTRDDAVHAARRLGILAPEDGALRSLR